jgi:transposase
MARRNFRLNDDQIQELLQAYTQCSDGPTRTRYQAVRLYGTGYPLSEVQDITGCSTTSLMEWCRAFAELGAKALVDGRLGGNSAKLSLEQRTEIEIRLHQYTPHDLFGSVTHTTDGQFWTVEDLETAVQQWYGVRYASRTSYSTLFHACGFSYHRPAKVFKSQRPIQMMEFEEQVEKN